MVQLITTPELREDVPFDDIKRRASVDYGYPKDEIVIKSVEDGYGVHYHDDNCQKDCYRHCNDSDWIVTVVYDGYHEAVYGVLDGEFSLWMD